MTSAPPRTAAPKDFLSILNLSAADLEALLARAAEMKAERRRGLQSAAVLASVRPVHHGNRKCFLSRCQPAGVLLTPDQELPIQHARPEQPLGVPAGEHPRRNEVANILEERRRPGLRAAGKRPGVAR